MKSFFFKFLFKFEKKVFLTVERSETNKTFLIDQLKTFLARTFFDNFWFQEKSHKILNPQIFSEKNFKNWIQVFDAASWADF